MPCYYPMQAFYSIRPDGKKDIKFSNQLAEMFRNGEKPSGDVLSLPCGKCMGCRLERSRQWAVRCMHEASLYDDNCFVTLTFDDKHLHELCPHGSIDRKHMQLFLKRVRKCFSDIKIRTFYCGEYGDNLGRPHYHALLFNLDFHDKKYFKTVNGEKYYVSDILSNLWPFGYSVLGDVTFESAAYVARYCTKKVTGPDAQAYYGSRLPEFSQASLKPGIGAGFFKNFGYSDIYSFDECVLRGVKMKPPRYYDKLMEAENSVLFEQIRTRRVERAEEKTDENSFRRLRVRERCHAARVKQLIRTLESS